MVTVEKRITVDLGTDTEISLPELMNNGYSRNHVVSLFTVLEELNFGKFIRGTRGRGQCAKFIKADNCPQEYTLVCLEKSRGRPKGSVNSLKNELKNELKNDSKNKIKELIEICSGKLNNNNEETCSLENETFDNKPIMDLINNCSNVLK